MYEDLKHTHMLFAVISISLFWYRVILKCQNSPKLNQRWLKIAPHFNDTWLLIAGISLAVNLGFNLSNSPWLVAKMIALLVYILLGFVTLKRNCANGERLSWAILATLVFISIGGFAVTKSVTFGL